MEQIGIARARGRRGSSSNGRRPGSTRKYLAGLFVLAFMAAVILAAAAIFTSAEIDLGIRYPIQMGTITIKDRGDTFTTIQPYLKVKQSGDLEEICRAMPRLRDAVIRELTATPRSTNEALDLDEVRRIIRLSLRKFLRSDSLVEDVLVTGGYGGGAVDPPRTYVVCAGEGGKPRVISQ